MDLLTAQLTHHPFPRLAEALRSVAERITLAWDDAVRRAMPQMRHLTFDELKDSTPAILLAIADALASDDPDLIRGLITHAPLQGLSRFHLNFDVIDVMQEDRLLRAITVEHVEGALGRRMEVNESAALHAAVDVMLQRSVIALVDEQKAQLRSAAETELKFLSFLSHDLNNNLNNVLLTLQVLGAELQEAGGFAGAEDALARARRAIADTVGGTRRMLDHARLGKAGRAAFVPVELRAVASNVAGEFIREAGSKGVGLAVEVQAGATVPSDRGLLSLVLQNLIGNALKFSSRGTVRVGSQLRPQADGARWVLWVSDEGPGIAPEHRDGIFEAFRRGNVHGQRGVGLGLAIASQAAKLLGAELTVESQVGAARSSGWRSRRRPTRHLCPERTEGKARMAPTEPRTEAAGAGDGSARIVAAVTALLRSNGYVACGPLRAAPPAILVAGDGRGAVGAGVELLRGDGYDALGADGYAAAVAAARARPFDLLLTDLDLIGGSGCGLLAELRGLYDIGGVAVSERRTAEAVRRARRAGFLFLLTGPLTLQRARHAVENAMARRSPRRAAPAGPAAPAVGRVPAPR